MDKVATLVNVCGVSRSGTTMFGLMLGNGPDVFYCGEVFARFRPWQKHHFLSKCRCGQVPCPVWEKIGAAPARRFHATVFEQLGVHFVVDSSKDLVWVIDTHRWAATSGIKVLNLLLWKSPINQAYSQWKRGEGLTGWRRAFVSYYKKFLQVGLPFRSVSFNDLVGNPQGKLSRICEIIGMPYFPGKERFWEEQHHYLFGSHGTYEQVAARKSVIRASEDFPPEFEAYVDDLARQIAQDSEVQQILGALQQMEVSNNNDDLGQEARAFEVRSPYPLWYYLMRIRQMICRYLPDRTGIVK
ncbi:MAG: hypothetical protein Kow0063_16860 [Anaerolineae bacterium]